MSVVRCFFSDVVVDSICTPYKVTHLNHTTGLLQIRWISVPSYGCLGAGRACTACGLDVPHSCFMRVVPQSHHQLQTPAHFEPGDGGAAVEAHGGRASTPVHRETLLLRCPPGGEGARANSSGHCGPSAGPASACAAHCFQRDQHAETWRSPDRS